LSKRKQAEKVDIDAVVGILREAVRDLDVPIVTEISQKRCDPFDILISTILSLRTKDEVTRLAADRLLSKASTAEEMLRLAEDEIARLIFPVGFYKTKAKTVLHVCSELQSKFDGRVPDSLEELLKLKGVGRKTANLVITLGFGKLGICVDTHVHRISNRLGYVKTKSPDETETALRKKLPKKYWIEYNDLLVTWGQNVCKPISPFCSVCAIESYCQKVGVDRRR
jgi:endonuclease-3